MNTMTEFVFSIPGVGSRDAVTVNACVLVIAVIIVEVIFLTEIINAFPDPKEQVKDVCMLGKVLRRPKTVIGQLMMLAVILLLYTPYLANESSVMILLN